MTAEEFFQALITATTYAEAASALQEFESEHEKNLKWVPLGGRANNRGTVEVSADPGRALIERVTNGVDAVLEDEYQKHDGKPEVRSPREAATAWLNVPEGGLADMTRQERQKLAQRVVVRLLPGDTKNARILEIRDRGIGIRPEDMPTTILSLNEGNKTKKHYLAGAYGQGGSATFVSSALTLIASRRAGNEIGFSVVRFDELEEEDDKVGRYVYLTLDGGVLKAKVPDDDFAVGTLARHFGYDLSGYPSPVGPSSVYGLMNRVLFDPVIPVWLDSRQHDYRRVIKGVRNALNGASDEGDDEKTKAKIVHRMPMLYVPLGEYGRIGIEYWVLERPTKSKKRPAAGFVNPAKPVVLTLNGQTHEELSSILLRKDAELPYLTARLICHIDCNSLTRAARRLLFVSNREGARQGPLLDLIKEELVRALRSDDELDRLNAEAKEASLHESDESAMVEAQKAVARLLQMQGLNVFAPVGSEKAKQDEAAPKPATPRPPRKKPQPIELHEPPTYIRLVWDEKRDLTFYPEQRRYLRIETDAHSNYHNAVDPAASRINIIVNGGEVAFRSSTPLQGGRMRALFDCVLGARVGGTGVIRVELSRPGHSVLSDEHAFSIVEAPPAKTDKREIALPPFKFFGISPDDEMWDALQWPEDVNAVASSAVMEDGVHIVYYSKVFPKFRAQFEAFERADPSLAKSFESRYRIWVTVHSLLLQHQQQVREAHQTDTADPEVEAEREREERIRSATLSAMFAAREVQMPEFQTATEAE